MRIPTIGCAALLLAILPAPSTLAQRAILLVRHAAKEADPQLLKAAGVDPEKLQDPENDRRIPLSTAGKARARALAAALSQAGINTIYTSQAERTQQTARPLAEALGLDLKRLDRDQLERFGDTHRDQTVLIVGHSNTVPGLIDTLTKRSNRIAIDDETFDNLFILVPNRDGSWGLIRSRY